MVSLSLPLEGEDRGTSRRTRRADFSFPFSSSRRDQHRQRLRRRSHHRLRTLRLHGRIRSSSHLQYVIPLSSHKPKNRIDASFEPEPLCSSSLIRSQRRHRSLPLLCPTRHGLLCHLLPPRVPLRDGRLRACGGEDCWGRVGGGSE